MGNLSDSIDNVLDLLAIRADGDPKWRTDLRTRLGTVVQTLEPHVPPGLHVDSGWGFGSMAQVPWVAILRPNQTNRVGHYPVLLFAADGSRLYLSLNQGLRTLRVAALDAESQRLRAELGQLGSRFSETIDLRGTTERPKKYERANITALQYVAGAIPADEVILADLDEVIALSGRLQEAQAAAAPSSASTWIFQSNPEFYDLPGALGKLKDFTWLVQQHVTQIHVGDRVYFWESGDDAGIVAVGHVLSEPAAIEESSEEPTFRRKPEKFEGLRRRVMVAVDNVLDQRLLRTTLKAHPVLRNLEILVFAQGSNFRVTPEQDLELRRLIAESTGPGQAASTADGIPQRFRRDLFDRAVGDLKAARASHGDLHQLACRQLTAWIEKRAELSDAELWAGLRDRFLPFGYADVDGAHYSQLSRKSPNRGGAPTGGGRGSRDSARQPALDGPREASRLDAGRPAGRARRDRLAARRDGPVPGSAPVPTERKAPAKGFRDRRVERILRHGARVERTCLQRDRPGRVPAP